MLYARFYYVYFRISKRYTVLHCVCRYCKLYIARKLESNIVPLRIVCVGNMHRYVTTTWQYIIMFSNCAISHRRYFVVVVVITLFVTSHFIHKFGVCNLMLVGIHGCMHTQDRTSDALNYCDDIIVGCTRNMQTILKCNRSNQYMRMCVSSLHLFYGEKAYRTFNI